VKGNAQFYGLLYAPNADAKISGSAIVYGSMVANNVTLTGNATIHYDEAFVDYTPSRGFIVGSWNEI
jgi:Putative Ice-binding-like adhesive domain